MITRFICLKLTDFLKISSEHLRTSKEMKTSDSIYSETLYTMKDMRCQAFKYIFDGHPRQNLSSWSNVTPPGLQSWLNQSSSNAMQMWWLLKLVWKSGKNMHQECYGCQAQCNSETNPRRMRGNFKKRWHLLFLESTIFLFLPVEADLVFQSPPLFLLWYES